MSCIITGRQEPGLSWWFRTMSDVGCIHAETITVVSLTSQLKRPELPAHYILDAAITSHLGYEIAWCVEAP